MSKSITPGELLAKVLKDEGISIRQLGKHMKLPPSRTVAMLESKRGFEDATLKKLAVAIPRYDFATWLMLMTLAKADRLIVEKECE